MSAHSKMVLKPKEVEVIAGPALRRLFKAVTNRDYLVRV